jgi:site-specific recombinase XerD
MKATTALFINKHSPNSKGECSISIRVTFERKRKYYTTGINLTEADFRKVTGERPKDKYKRVSIKLRAFEQKAYDMIQEMSVFSWEKFDKLYYSNRAAREFVAPAFQEVINDLKKEERLGTASSYECAINSISKFKKDLKFQDVTVAFLKSYEKHMLNEGKSKSTIGIYLRPLRAIFNIAISNGYLSKEYYPFGKRRYEIPTSKNIKKAVSIQKIGEIFKYQPKSATEEKFRDYWLFLYLCNGMNVKDMCQLKYHNIKGNTIEFIRAKTGNTKRVSEPIVVSLLDETKNIIEKWGNKKIDENAYLFPVFTNDLSKKRERELVKLLVKNINNYISEIGNTLGIEHKLTTYWARHSFGTILMYNGNSAEFIREAFGHSDIKTTLKYLSSFETEKKAEAAKALVAF